MPDLKISQLPAAGALTGAELVPIVQAGVTDQTTTAQIAALGGAGGVDISDEGVPQGTATVLDFVGDGVTASVAAGTATITVFGAVSTMGDFELDPASADHANPSHFVFMNDTFTDYLVDAAITPTSRVLVWQSATPATGRAPGDALWDNIQIAVLPGSGTATLLVNCASGSFVNVRSFHYAVFN